jgi:hypothetical protein
MQNIKLNDTPEHNRLLWALVAITLASLFFGCEADYVDQNLADFWWLWIIPAGLLWWQQRQMPAGINKSAVSFFAVMCLGVLIFPYCLMFGVWAILNLIP